MASIQLRDPNGRIITVDPQVTGQGFVDSLVGQGWTTVPGSVPQGSFIGPPITVHDAGGNPGIQQWFDPGSGDFQFLVDPNLRFIGPGTPRAPRTGTVPPQVTTSLPPGTTMNYTGGVPQTPDLRAISGLPPLPPTPPPGGGGGGITPPPSPGGGTPWGGQQTGTSFWPNMPQNPLVQAFKSAFANISPPTSWATPSQLPGRPPGPPVTSPFGFYPTGISRGGPGPSTGGFGPGGSIK